jgi:KaiC/GvpD/RAD55 family RecA-like ATPase
VADGMRVTTGITGFDELIEGGFPKERTIILRGPAGSGKTTFGIQCLPKDMDQLINVYHQAGADSSVFKAMRDFSENI